MKKLPQILIGLLIVVLVGGFVYMKTQPNDLKETLEEIEEELEMEEESDDEENSTENTVSTETEDEAPIVEESTQEEPSGISMAMVAQHNSSASCWSVINGSVYDLTSWISQHPGGEQNILRICGIDGTVAFNGQHGSSNHAVSTLASFKIGDLTQ